MPEVAHRSVISNKWSIRGGPQKKDALKISELVSVFFILSPKNGE
jgi:hypothetical protein